jgi:hypothetical protein
MGILKPGNPEDFILLSAATSPGQRKPAHRAREFKAPFFSPEKAPRCGTANAGG